MISSEFGSSTDRSDHSMFASISQSESLCSLTVNHTIRFEISGLPAAAIEPVTESSVSTVEERTLEEGERWWKMGLKGISDGKLAVLLLSGGQDDAVGSFYTNLSSFPQNPIENPDTHPERLKPIERENSNAPMAPIPVHHQKKSSSNYNKKKNVIYI
ncbi:udp-n-acetylglucosamine diphosphorylase 2 [Quercus suber]|uniref:Udp-n-acetylglucosamine diphosphorylase 2 n=1 Tax=Quercus suber TaxID=58331 RepID=A0AAW0LWJ3_QUESU